MSNPSPPNNDPWFDGPFPPSAPVPVVERCDPILWGLAEGAPGDMVRRGLFPRDRAKLARLALAAAGRGDPSTLAEVARRCDHRERSHFHRSYHAHDAFAAALVHPGIGARERADIASGILGGRSGWRSRRKSWAIARWARSEGYLDPRHLGVPIVERLLDPVALQRRLGRCRAWGEVEVMDALMLAMPDRWGARRMAEVHVVQPYASGIAAIGGEVASALRHDPMTTARVFSVVERGFTVGDSAARDLVADLLRGLGGADRDRAVCGPTTRAVWASLR